MRNIDLKNRKIIHSKLIQYGFNKEGKKYIFEKNIFDDFKIIVNIENDILTSKLMDNDTEYILVDVDTSIGQYVGKVRYEYENVIKDIIDKCTIIDVFKSDYSKKIINYIKEKYNDELEFLWKKFDNAAIIRNKINSKWYVLFMIVEKNKIGIDSDELIEIIDLRYEKGCTDKIVDNKVIFPGYHMNKNSWITIKLDGSIDINEILKLIDNSYNLSLNKKR